MKQFNDKCINTKNKMKGFLNFIKGHNYVNSPSQVLLVVSSIGQDRVDTENNIFQCEVEDFV